MSGETHYGVLYISGHVADFGPDRDRAVTEYQVLVRKGTRGVRLVKRKVGPWHPAPGTEGGNQR